MIIHSTAPHDWRTWEDDKWYEISIMENPYKDSIRLLCTLTMKGIGDDEKDNRYHTINSLWYEWREVVSLTSLGIYDFRCFDGNIKDYLVSEGRESIHIAEDLNLTCTKNKPTKDMLARLEQIKIKAMRDFKKRAVDAITKAIPYKWFSTHIASVDLWVEAGGFVTDCVKYESISKKDFKKILDEMKKQREEISK